MHNAKFMFCVLCLFLSMACGCQHQQTTAKHQPQCAEKQSQLPPDLMWEGRALDAWIMCEGISFSPRCIEDLIKEKQSKIEALSDHDSRAPAHASEMTNRGWIGYYYLYENATKGSCYWKYLGTIPGTQKHLIETDCWGGGSGSFSSIFILVRHGNILEKKAGLFGGDRAQGGIADASFHHGTLFVKEATTPSYLFSNCLDRLLSEQSENISEIKGYSIVNYKNVRIPIELKDVPLCFAGQMACTWKDGITLLTSIELEVSGCDTTNDGLLQQCFDTILQKNIKTDRKILDTTKKMSCFAKEILDLYVSKYKEKANLGIS